MTTTMNHQYQTWEQLINTPMNATLNQPKNTTARPKQAFRDPPPNRSDNIAGEVSAPEVGDRVENRIACLIDAADLLEKEVSALHSALAPVLQPEDPNPPGGIAGVLHPDSCAVVAQLRTINSRLLEHISALTSIRNRLRL